MAQDKSGIPHLFDRWNEISARLQGANDIRLFLDFDGTLVSYCPSPKDVALDAAAKRVLRQLSRHRRVHVAIVSGRRSAVLHQFVNIPHIQLMGLYGSEFKRTLHPSRVEKRALDGVRGVLASLPTEFPGVRLEDKGASVAIHYFEVGPDVRRELQKRIRRSLMRNRADLRVIRGNHSVEVVPRQVQGKGVALREFTRSLRSPFLPIYVGDDLSDEPAFKTLRRGITIRVGTTAPTNASFRLNDPLEVREFLERLEEELP